MAQAQVAKEAQATTLGWWRWIGDGRWRLLLFAGTTVLVLGIYLLVNRSLGFPLDDAWIHQDFARTLAQTGHFAFAPERGGAGSTSPLWVLLLAPAQLVPNAPIWLVVGWADLLGAISLVGLAWATSTLALLWLDGCEERLRSLGALIAGLAVIAEWHLTWAALSGMETGLFTCLSVLLLLGVGRRWHPAWLGLLGALLTDTRPEGVLLAALVAGALALRHRPWRLRKPHPAPAPEDAPGGVPLQSPPARAKTRRWPEKSGQLRSLSIFLGVFALGIAPLLALNEVVAGHLLPSTFYAKGTFYALGSSELGRLASYALGVLGFLGSSPLVALGLPGACYLLWRTQHTPQRLTLALALAWVLALIGGYAIHLPVVYQNGRYLMPVLPVLLTAGVAGSVRFLAGSNYRLLAAALAVVALG